jgi:hypothetical protein
MLPLAVLFRFTHGIERVVGQVLAILAGSPAETVTAHRNLRRKTSRTFRVKMSSEASSSSSRFM